MFYEKVVVVFIWLGYIIKDIVVFFDKFVWVIDNVCYWVC